jgi:hypothetical protein
MRLQPGGLGLRIYIPQDKVSPVVPPGNGFPFFHLLRLIVLRWRYSNPPSRGAEAEVTLRLAVSQSVSQSVSTSWCRAHCGTCHQVLIRSEFCCLSLSVWCPLWWEVGSVSCKSLSAVIVHRQVFCLFFTFHFTRHTFYVCTIHARPG